MIEWKKQLVVFFLGSALLWAAKVETSYDSPKSLKSSNHDLESAFHTALRDSLTLQGVYPRAGLDSQHFLSEARLKWLGSSNQGWMTIQPEIAGEIRHYSGYDAEVGELRLNAQGGIGWLSFRSDVGMFIERQNPTGYSFDGEYLETQDEDINSNFTFTSYSRYRSIIALDLPIGRVAAGRDVQHWGPMFRYPLVFGQESVPFNQLYYTAQFGPFLIRSLYGELVIDGDGEFRSNKNERTVFAHRYEWMINPQFTLGISDMLVLVNSDNPFAFAPFFPLFVEKGNSFESDNNGMLSIDFNWVLFNKGRLYGEFLIDDVSELSALFNDYWGNKWAFSIGSQWLLPLPLDESGVIFEFSRVEPWVYTHYSYNWAQIANHQRSLSHPNGPNSQSLFLRIFGKKGIWYGALQSELIWKGDDRGSAISDTLHDNLTVQKEFLAGDIEPELSIGPELSFFYDFIGISLLNYWIYKEDDWSFNVNIRGKLRF